MLALDNDSDRRQIPIGLSPTAKLYVGGRTIAHDCSSFTCDNNHLIYATFSHQVKFIDTNDLCRFYRTDPADTNETHPLQVDNISHVESTRAVERGSCIITSIPSSMKLVLQMPRGNLETIYPRPMVLRRICVDLLVARRWREAFLECRKHKIDFNLLVDFDTQTFLDTGAKEFVQDVQDVDHINLFLSGMKETNVTEHIYPITGKWKKKVSLKSDRFATLLHAIIVMS